MPHGMLLAWNFWHHVSFLLLHTAVGISKSLSITHPSYLQWSMYLYLHMVGVLLTPYLHLCSCCAEQFGLLGQLCMYPMPYYCLQFHPSQLDSQYTPIPPPTPSPPDYSSIHCGSTVSHPAILPLPTQNSTQTHWPVIQPSFPNLETRSVRHKLPVQYRPPASTPAPISNSG